MDDIDDLLRAPVRVPTGENYFSVLSRIHAMREPEWYLEVGTDTGKSLVLAQGKSVAVDPRFRCDGAAIVGSKPELHMFQTTSDDFFDSGKARAVAADGYDFFFLDGMHKFEFLLRDFMNAEKHAAPGALVAMHDCVPSSYVAADREWRKDVTNRWMGDVWKVVPILREFRPDLTVLVADCAPSGLTLVSDLDPTNDALEENYDRIMDRYMSMQIDDFGASELELALDLTPVSDPRVAGLVGAA